ncbi:MAG: NAD-dependent epimerase/dehydratase family protein [Candidatus Binatia bacterium]|nr:NAD-dependent epimerase/dehydratase family protein [Candidatus Binatia bacterium]
MSIAIITGSAGLIGSEAARFFHAQGLDIVGIDNDMRSYFFGAEASTAWSREQLERELPRYSHAEIDIRDAAGLETLFRDHGSDVAVIIHAAAQPSHDWAAREPATDFGINGVGTLNMLEATRQHCSDACFVFLSTNKVYGDRPNELPLVELETRWEVEPSHPYAERGIDETMSIDQSTHSLFGVSKAAADLLVQEYGRYFGLKTGVFRGGCLTGGGHSGTELHGFLSYIVRCTLEQRPYTVYGYKGKQVRDNIHSSDLVSMFWHFFQAPRAGEVYNVGGSRHSNCSLLEARELCAKIAGKELEISYSDENRVGDHIWYVSDVSRFRAHYPEWSYSYDLPGIFESIVAGWRQRLS